MVKKIISVATAFLMLCCMVPFYAFAESATCPKCGKDTLITNQDISIEIGEEVGLPLSLKRAYCSNCHYAKYEYNVLGVAGEQAYDDGDESHIINFLKSLKEQLLGKNANATKFESGGGSTSGGGVGRPKGYADDNGTPNIYPSGSLVYMVEPYGIGAGEFFATIGFRTSLSNSTYVIPSPSASGTSFISGYGATAIFKFVAPVSGVYYIGSEGGKYNLGTFDLFYNNDWISFDYLIVPSKKYEYSCTVNKGDTVYFYYTHRASQYNSYAYRYSLTSIPIFVDLLADSSITTTNNITINNNTWNGNIYTDNSTNLTYIYPQYTTINEKNETVINISNTPIIYNNETKQYYTYDQTTKNYYYITYNAQPTPSPSPTPNPGTTPTPTPKPGGSISTPETGKPGGDSGDTTGILAVLVEIRDNMIQGFLDIKAAFVAGFAELSANFTLAIENLNVNIQNIFNKKFPDQSTPETALPSPTPSPSPAPDPGTDPTPVPTPGDGTVPAPGGDSNISGGDDEGLFGWLWDLLKDLVKAILKAIFKILSNILGFLIWIVERVGLLLPFLPAPAIAALGAGVVLIFVIRIIRFIRG